MQTEDLKPTTPAAATVVTMRYRTCGIVIDWIVPAGLPEERTMSWQEIETAPKNGVFLVSDGKQVTPVERGTVLYDLTSLDYGGYDDLDYTPTHWMPLPEPPSAPPPPQSPA